ncbi:hypothetical protein V8D89_004427 [Ganoderma adspersum]
MQVFHPRRGFGGRWSFVILLPKIFAAPIGPSVPVGTSIQGLSNIGRKGMTRGDRKAGYREGACGRRRSGPDRKRRGEEGPVRKSPASFQTVLVPLHSATVCRRVI